MVLLAKDEGGHQFEGEICAGKVLVIFCFFFCCNLVHVHWFIIYV